MLMGQGVGIFEYQAVIVEGIAMRAGMSQDVVPVGDAKQSEQVAEDDSGSEAYKINRHRALTEQTAAQCPGLARHGLGGHRRQALLSWYSVWPARMRTPRRRPRHLARVACTRGLY